MKKLMLLSCVFLLSLILSAETIKITSGEWAPFTSSSAEDNGVALAAVKAAFKEVGIDVEFGFFPWKRAMKNIEKNDEWEASGVWGYNEERAKSFYFSDPICESKSVVFHLKDKEIMFNGEPESLKPYNTGITLGYSYGKDFDKAINDKIFPTETAPRDLMNFKKLLNPT